MNSKKAKNSQKSFHHLNNTQKKQSHEVTVFILAFTVQDRKDEGLRETD